MNVSNSKFFLLSFLLISATNSLKAQPNFVVIVTDDQGWTGTSVQMDSSIADSKSDFYKTPALELFAQSAMIFSQAYAPAPKCSPTRCSILTGRTTARNQFTDTGNTVIPGQTLIAPLTNTAINGTDTTIAEWLKMTNLNYRTAHFGKWHLGSTDASSPGNNGFDYNDGNTNNGDGNQDSIVQVDPKKIFDLTNRSISFIQDAVTASEPFFLQLSHYAVHADIEARKETIDLYNDQGQRPPGTIHNEVEYGAMTEDIDDGIGQVLTEILNLGIDSNTYIIVMSDNGGQQNITSNAPLKLGKTFLYEGGIRVPFMVSGPMVVPNSYNTTPIVAYDLFPTIASLVGSDVPLPSNLDGVDISPLFTGSSIARTNSIYFHAPNYSSNPNKAPRSAAVEGNYKLMVNYDTGDLDLFDLENDIGESTDISANFPDITNYFRIRLRDHLQSANANMPSLDTAAFSGIAPDIDQDSLNDVWEFSNLLTHIFDANDDPDNDSMTNLQEQVAGTDPLVDESAPLIAPCLWSNALDNRIVALDESVPVIHTLWSERSYEQNVTVNYTAGYSINLTEGFFVSTGTIFTAEIESCVAESGMD